MGGAHDHDHDHDHDHEGAGRPLRFALALTAGFLGVEVVGGWLTGSLALLADAGHMASDVGALGVALLAARIAARPPDTQLSMGYQRAEVLGAGLNAGALVVLALWIVTEAVGRLADPPPVLGAPMAAVAIAGLLVNVAVAWRLHGREDLNSRAALWHVLGDLLGSIGAVIAGALVWGFGWTVADPAISLGIAAILAVGSVRVLREVAAVLMHVVPAHVDLEGLRARIAEVPGVGAVHALHVWALRPGEDVVSVHVVLCDGSAAEATCAAVRAAIYERLPRAHVTVQPEGADAPCARAAG